MQEFIDKVFDWPVLGQAVLGSFIFWLLYISGSYLAKKISEIYSAISSKHAINKMKLKGANLAFRHFKEPEKRAFWLLVPMRYAMTRAIKALLFISMGVILGYFISIFYVIGFSIGLYYLFLANNAFIPTKDIEDDEILDEIKDLMSEINKLKEKT